MKHAVALLVLLPLCLACSQPEKTSPDTAGISGEVGKDERQKPPMQIAAEDPKRVAEAQKELDTLKSNYETAKGVYEKRKDNKTAKEAYIVAAVKYGHESMMSPALEAKVKYRQALKVYREVLKIDPKNEVAKKESDLIVSIYQQMGRPVPE